MKFASLGTLGRSVLFLVVTYAATFAAVQLTQQFATPESLAPGGAMVVVQILALAIARRLGTRTAGYVVGVLGAILLSEFVIQSIFGVKSLHSAPVHYAVALAAAFGIRVGVLMARRPSMNRTVSEPSLETVR